MAAKYYENKEAMFAAAMRLPSTPSSALPELLAPGLDGIGQRLVRATFEVFGDEETRAELMTLFQAGASTAQAAACHCVSSSRSPSSTDSRAS